MSLSISSRVSFSLLVSTPSFANPTLTTFPELQGQATKNQDLLVASGAVSLKGSEGLSAVDDDILAAVSSFPLGRISKASTHSYFSPTCCCFGTYAPPYHPPTFNQTRSSRLTFILIIRKYLFPAHRWFRHILGTSPCRLSTPTPQ